MPRLAMNRILIVAPHPDDEAIGCAGAILNHMAQGDVVRVVFLTSGEKGHPQRTALEAAEIRESEAKSSLDVLGVENYEFWHFVDGRLRASRLLVERLRDEFASWRPHEVYVTHSYEMHADHRAAARAVKFGLDTMSIPVWMFEVWTPLTRIDRIVDISPFIDRKVAAVRAYASQCELVKFDEAALGLARYRGELHSWPGGDYAEVFTAMR